MRKTLLLTFLFAPLCSLWAQEGDSISIAASLFYRARGEFHAAYHQPLGDLTPALFISQRTEAGLSLRYKQATCYFNIQDGRVWGARAVTPSLLEGWFDYKTPFGELRLGRQTIQITDGWLFMAGRYGKTGLSHDALRYTLVRPKFDLLAYGMANASSEKDPPYQRDKPHNYKYMGVLRARLLQSFGFMGVVDVAQDLKQAKRHYPRLTAGLFVEKLPTELLSLKAEAYYQTGEAYQIKKDDGTKFDVSAFSLHSKLLVRTKFPFGVGVDWVSGDEDDDAANGTQHHFDRLSGSGHGFFGWMDYFSLSLSEVQGRGLRDYSLWLYTPRVKGHAAECALHTLQQDKGKSPILGYEFDVKYSFTPTKDMRLEAVCGAFYATSAYKEQVVPTEGKTGYFMTFCVQYAPRFLHTLPSH